MCLINFTDDIWIIVMARLLKGSNDFYTETHDMEIHLNRHKKHIEEGGKATHDNSGHHT